MYCVVRQPHEKCINKAAESTPRSCELEYTADRPGAGSWRVTQVQTGHMLLEVLFTEATLQSPHDDLR